MRLSELRRVTVKKSVRVRFRLTNGMECILDEHGIAHVPALKAPPDFNLEDEFARAGEFVVEPAVPVGRLKARVRPEVLNREQLAAFAAPASGLEAVHEEHDD